MFHSKSLKDFPNYKPMNKVKEFFLFSLYYPVGSFFSRLVERVSRSYAFAKFGYMHYDFDHVYLYTLMSFKLKRIKKCLENGHAVQEDHNMAALQEAIEICDRLGGEGYDDKYYDLLDQKWGESEFSFTPDGNGLSTFNSNRKNRVTPEDHEQYNRELLAYMDSAELDRKNDIDRLADILKVNGPTWWD